MTTDVLEQWHRDWENNKVSRDAYALFLSEECLFIDDYTPKQYEEDYGNSRIYYTEWEK